MDMPFEPSRLNARKRHSDITESNKQRLGMSALQPPGAGQILALSITSYVTVLL